MSRGPNSLSDFHLADAIELFCHGLQAALAAAAQAESTRQASDKENMLPHADLPADSARPPKHQLSRPRGWHEKRHEKDVASVALLMKLGRLCTKSRLPDVRVLCHMCHIEAALSAGIGSNSNQRKGHDDRYSPITAATSVCLALYVCRDCGGTAGRPLF